MTDGNPRAGARIYVLVQFIRMFIGNKCKLLDIVICLPIRRSQ